MNGKTETFNINIRREYGRIGSRKVKGYQAVFKKDGSWALEWEPSLALLTERIAAINNDNWIPWRLNICKICPVWEGNEEREKEFHKLLSI